tara:strand:- start:800 stop:1219 length:420 start_codon:yes stop_codon:yes gene_type:complete
MSTRAVYEFNNKENPYDKSVVSVYKHYDGYPEGGIGFIKNAKDLYESGVFNGNFEYKDDVTARDGMVLAFMSHPQNEGSKSFTESWENHGDLEYFYKIYANESVEIFSVASWENEGRPELVFQGSIEDAFNNYVKKGGE